MADGKRAYHFHLVSFGGLAIVGAAIASVTQSEQQSGIYCIRNTVSGRCYVGSAVCIQRRWYVHRNQLVLGKHHSRSLNSSWIKHGADAFSFEVLEFVSDPSNLIEREQHWIDKLNSACPKTGFNMYPHAGSPLGTKHSPERSAIMSEFRTGRKMSDQMKEKVRASKLKLYSSPEMRERLREQAVKAWENRRLAGKQLGFPHTEETKKKMSLAKTGKMTDAHKAAIAASNKRRVTDRQVFGPLLHR